MATTYQNYILFNADGSIKTLVVGESINQGSNNVNKFFVAVDGRNAEGFSCDAQFVLPNGEIKELTGEHKSFTLGLLTYDGYEVSLLSSVTYLAGNLKMNLDLIDLQSNALYTYQVNLKVNPTGYIPSETTITESQYLSLLQSLNSYQLRGEGGGGSANVGVVVVPSTLDFPETINLNEAQVQELSKDVSFVVLLMENTNDDVTSKVAYILEKKVHVDIPEDNTTLLFEAVAVYGDVQTTHEILSLDTLKGELDIESGELSIERLSGVVFTEQGLVKNLVCIHPLNGSKTLLEYVGLYDQDSSDLTKQANFIGYYNGNFYSFYISSISDATVSFEIKGLSNGKTRYHGELQPTTLTVAQAINSAYQDNLVSESDINLKTIQSTDTIQSLLDTYGANGFTFFCKIGNGTSIYALGVNLKSPGYVQIELEHTANKTRFSSTNFATSNTIGDLMDLVLGEYKDDYLTQKGGLPYLTTAPSADNTDGIKIVVLTSEPATKYNGYLYIITGSNS